MISSEQLIELSKKGRDVRVAKDAGDNRQVIVLDRTRSTQHNIEIPREVYENLMEDTVAKLVARFRSTLHWRWTLHHPAPRGFGALRRRRLRFQEFALVARGARRLVRVV